MARGWFVFLVIATIVIVGCTAKEKTIEQRIKERLTGEKIIYYSIAGQPINFTISTNDIKSIEKVEIKGEILWRVRVGEDLMWDIYLDKDGKKIVKKEQLFVT